MDLLPYRRKAHYYETDAMEIIHHSNYIRWFEEARVDFMDQIGIGYKEVVDAGIDFAMLGVNCEYKSMVRFGDVVEIYSSMTVVTPTRVTVSYRVVDAESGQLRTTGETNHCFYSRVKNRPVSLKRELPELYELFERYRVTGE